MKKIGALWKNGGKTKTLRETPVSDVESDDGFSDESDVEIAEDVAPIQPAKKRRRSKKSTTKSKSVPKSKQNPKKKTSKSKTNVVLRKSSRASAPPQMLVRGQGMQMEGGKWQDYIPPEVKSMAMKQARKFAGKVIASDDLFGSGMYRD